MTEEQSFKFFRADEEWLFNSRISKLENKWLLHGEGFSIAIKVLDKYILEENRSNQDFVIYPYCYLIRHYIEIRLKEIIDEGNKIMGHPLNKVRGGHDLSVLWIDAQEVLQKVWNTKDLSIPKIVNDFIKELNIVDHRSDNFRYPVDKEYNDTLDELAIINFKVIAEAFADVEVYLGGATDGLAARKDGDI